MYVFWLILMVCVLALVQVAYYNRHGLDRVEYERRFSKKRVFAGDSLEMVEVLANDKLTPLPWVRIESRISQNLRFGKQDNLDINMDRFHKSMFFMGPYKRITRRHQVTAVRRGYYDCRSVSLSVGDLLGLATKSCDLQCDARLMVYPRLTLPEDMPVQALEWQGDVSVRRWIDPDPVLVNGIREYVHGDPRKDVHWPATARTGQLMVKIRDYTVTPRLLVLLNSQISEFLWGAMEPRDTEKLEHGVSLAAALVNWGVSHGMNVGFRSNGGNALSSRAGEYISVDPAAGNLDRVLEALAVLVIKRQVDFAKLMDYEIDRRTSGMDILCISAYWSEALEERASQLRRMGNSVTFMPVQKGGRT